MKEKIIKSKERVQKHGEVFTPRKIVNKMLDIPEINNASKNLHATFLEPAAGEGAFLVEILKRKLEMVSRKYNNDLNQYENFSLFALTTLYGIELLEDNAQICVMNMFQTYYEQYRRQVKVHKGRIKQRVLDSAKKIITSNIATGDFLTRKAIDGKPIVFSEWEPINLRENSKNIRIQRTEYTLDEIYNNVRKEKGRSINGLIDNKSQISIFDILNEEQQENEEQEVFKYIPAHITNIYKEEMIKVDG